MIGIVLSSLSLGKLYFDDYREIRDAFPAPVTTTHHVTIQPGGTENFLSTDTVQGSTEPCPWRTYVDHIFYWQHADHITNESGQPVTFAYTLKVQNGYNDWQSFSTSTIFGRSRTMWIYNATWTPD